MTPKTNISHRNLQVGQDCRGTLWIPFGQVPPVTETQREQRWTTVKEWAILQYHMNSLHLDFLVFTVLFRHLHVLYIKTYLCMYNLTWKEEESNENRPTNTGMNYSKLASGRRWITRGSCWWWNWSRDKWTRWRNHWRANCCVPAGSSHRAVQAPERAHCVGLGTLRNRGWIIQIIVVSIHFFPKWTWPGYLLNAFICTFWRMFFSSSWRLLNCSLFHVTLQRPGNLLAQNLIHRTTFIDLINKRSYKE